VVLAKQLRPGRGWESLENRRVPPLDAASSTLNPDRFGQKDLVYVVIGRRVFASKRFLVQGPLIAGLFRQSRPQDQPPLLLGRHEPAK
jgi:hypothetical protein